MKIRFILAALTVILTANTVRAEECPDEIPDDGAVRRAQAKKWFSKGQTASSEGDDIAGLKAYQCSLRFVPHGFTSYNIGQVAERIGDLEVAIAGYSQYLLLVPDAVDAQEVNGKITSLKDRLAKARQKEIEITAVAPAAPLTMPGAIAVGTSASPAAHAPEKPPAAAPAVDTGFPDSVVETKSPGNGYRTAAWIVYGGAVAALAGGLVTNLSARSKMDSCRSKYNNGNGSISAAESACDDAKPLAYMSYALFGVGAAAAVIGTVLVLHPTESSEVAFNLLPEGGLNFGWAGKF